MMPKGKRRLVKLRQSGNFRYLGRDLTLLNRREGDGTKWASCAVQDSIKFPSNRPLPGKAGSIYGGRIFEYVTIGFASFIFAPISAGGQVLGYAGNAISGTTPILSTGALGQAGLFITGALGALGFANPQIQTTKGANFNKPCDPNAGKF